MEKDFNGGLATMGDILSGRLKKTLPLEISPHPSFSKREIPTFQKGREGGI